MPPIQGILETALYVSDIERAARWYQDVFKFARLFADDRLVALNVAPRSVLLLFRESASETPNPVPGGIIPSHGGTGKLHFAFSIGRDDVESWREWLRGKNIEIQSEVVSPQGGHSLYLRDPDQNLVELITPGFWANDL